MNSDTMDDLKYMMLKASSSLCGISAQKFVFYV